MKFSKNFYNYNFHKYKNNNILNSTRHSYRIPPPNQEFVSNNTFKQAEQLPLLYTKSTFSPFCMPLLLPSRKRTPFFTKMTSSVETALLAEEKVIDTYKGICIGLTGKSRHGKSTVADYLAIKYDFKEIAFAKPLKLGASGLFSIPLCDFYDEKAKNTIVERYKKSPRQLLQFLGTDVIRNLFDKDFLTNSAFWKLQQMVEENPEQNIVFSDCRFDNEAGIISHINNSAIWKLDATIRMNTEKENLPPLDEDMSSKYVDATAHESEDGLSEGIVDTVIFNNDSTSDLYANIDLLYNELQCNKRNN